MPQTKTHPQEHIDGRDHNRQGKSGYPTAMKTGEERGDNRDKQKDNPSCRAADAAGQQKAEQQEGDDRQQCERTDHRPFDNFIL